MYKGKYIKAHTCRYAKAAGTTGKNIIDVIPGCPYYEKYKISTKQICQECNEWKPINISEGKR